MPNSSLTESQHANFVRNQQLFVDHARERLRTLGLRSGIDNPVIHPTFRPVFAIDSSLVKLARDKNNGNFSILRQVLYDHMGFHCGCKPLIDGTRPTMDVRPRIVGEIVFMMWYEKMRSCGYRFLTEKAAAELHARKTSIFLRSYMEDYYSADYKRSRKIRHAVRLVCPQQQIVDGYEHTSYCLEAAYSKKEYNFSILAASYLDTTMLGLWLYKPSARHKA